MKKLINEFYPQVKLNIVFTNNFQIKNFFKFKDTLEDCLRSSVTYKFSCCWCDATYLGKTSRHLFVRESEHLGRSYRSNQILSSPPFSAIRDHAITTGHAINRENFSIIANAKSEFELNIKESILIKQMSPSLNNTDSYKLRVLN